MAIVSMAKSLNEYANQLWQVELTCHQCRRVLAQIVLPATTTNATGDLTRRLQEERDKLGVSEFCSERCRALFKQQEYEKAKVNDALTQMLEGKL